jgi:hypothetical protein
MLAEVRERVNPLVEGGKSLAQVVAAKPTRALDEKWGKGFLTGDFFVQMLYQGLTTKRSAEGYAWYRGGRPRAEAVSCENIWLKPIRNTIERDRCTRKEALC